MVLRVPSLLAPSLSLAFPCWLSSSTLCPLSPQLALHLWTRLGVCKTSRVRLHTSSSLTSLPTVCCRSWSEQGWRGDQHVPAWLRVLVLPRESLTVVGVVLRCGLSLPSSRLWSLFNCSRLGPSSPLLSSPLLSSLLFSSLSSPVYSSPLLSTPLLFRDSLPLSFRILSRYPLHLSYQLLPLRAPLPPPY